MSTRLLYMLFLFLTIFVNINLSRGIVEDALEEVSALDMTYYFYSLQNPDKPVEVKSNNIDAIKKTHFNGSKETLILIHGWFDTASGLLVQTVKKEIIAGNHDINLIGLDWSPIWRNTSNHEPWEIKSGKAGRFIADFLGVLARDYGLKYSKLTITGHSAGGPVSAGIGSALEGQVKRIVALDTENVTKSEAKFVEYIHTSYVSGTEAWGHLDFFPNGGLNQTNCEGLGCNHVRSIFYYAESINSNKFIARECDTYENYAAGKCNFNSPRIMGGLERDIIDKASGKYFLSTNGKSPFARG